MYISTELSEKFFRKMPPLIGKELEKAYMEKYPGSTVGVMPRIYFSYQYLAEQCKRAALQRSLKDLSFCSQIPIPGYYQKNKRYGIRKAKTYRGKPHDTHIRVFKRKNADKVRKCKCFICGEEGHFARDCRKQRGNIARAAIVENLDLNEDWDVLSVDQDEPDSDAICSLSEGEVGNAQKVTIELGDIPSEVAYMVTSEDLTWRKQPNLPKEVLNCSHEWRDNSDVPRGKEHCKCCGEMTNSRMRAFCEKCELTVCPMCSRFILGRKIQVKTQTMSPYDGKDKLINELLGYINFLLAENEKLKLQLMERTIAEEMAELGDVDFEKMRKGKSILEEEEEEDLEEEFAKEFNKGPGIVIRDCTAKLVEERIETLNATSNPKGMRVINRLYNMEVKIRIPGIEEFKVQAILDTGASACCINESAVPKEALEASSYPTQITGVNSQQISTLKLKYGQMVIDENRFPIPFTYAFPMRENPNAYRMQFYSGHARRIED